MGYGVENFHRRKVNQQEPEMTVYLDFLLRTLDPWSRTIPVPEDSKSYCLEVGVGRGGTHFLWSQLFDYTISVDNNFRRTALAAASFDQEASCFVCSSSTDPRTVDLVKGVLNGREVDHLFIDGGHKEDVVTTDYKLYEPLVRKGGVIGFHDCFANNHNIGVRHFIGKLEKGKITGTPVKLTKVGKSEGPMAFGIAWYVK